MVERLLLPNVDRATVPADKLRDYALDPDHPRGRHKARVFAAVLGIDQADWRYLRDQILWGLPHAEVTAVRESPPHGFLYEVPMSIDGLSGATAEVVTAWLLASPESGPRLVSAYVNRP